MTKILNTVANLRDNNKKESVLQWFSQSPDFNLVEMMWWDLKRAVQKQPSVNLNEPTQCCEEWAKIPPKSCDHVRVKYRTTTRVVIKKLL